MQQMRGRTARLERGAERRGRAGKGLGASRPGAGAGACLPGPPAPRPPGPERSAPRAAPRPPRPRARLPASRPGGSSQRAGLQCRPQGRACLGPSTLRRAGLQGSKSPPRFLLSLSVRSRSPVPEPQSPLGSGSGSEAGGKPSGARLPTHLTHLEGEVERGPATLEGRKPRDTESLSWRSSP